MYQYSETLKEKVEAIYEIGKAQPTASSKWKENLPKELQTNVVQLLKSNSTLIDTLKTILAKEYEAELRSPRMEYSNANWALLQADKNGYKRAIENFINLLTIKDV